jgi:predicted Zn finger-like uncharacterized protein
MIISIMLVTTCPECATTFRITEEILGKAEGQVRCGRCAHVFDGNTSLREQPETETRPIEPQPAATETVVAEEPTFEAGLEIGIARGWILQDDPPEDAASPEVVAAPEPADVTQVPEPVTVESAAVEPPEPEIEMAEAAAHAADATWLSDLGWLPPDAETEHRRSWPWVAGVAVLGLALAGQLIHRFRSALAEVPVAGNILSTVYGAFGHEISPPVNLDQYDTLDLTAVAQPVTDEQGWLIIESRIQNKGPKIQPFPHIFVGLVDRWEETIAGRYFGPDEYALTPLGDTSRMNIGSTIDAQFIIVDPGPGATGFELKFCTPVADRFNCESDDVFK